MNIAEKKQLAQALFIAGTINRKDIATQVGCTPKTLRSWIDKGEWDSLKEAKSITRKQLLQDAYAQLRAINKKIQDDFDGVPNKELSDAKAVLRKEIETLSDNPLYKYVEVFEDFLEWLSRNDPKQTKSFSELSMKFIAELNKKQS